jgi:hypothetical protein
MVKTVVLDSLKDFKNLRVMMIVIMLGWILARCGLQQDSSPSSEKGKTSADNGMENEATCIRQAARKQASEQNHGAAGENQDGKFIW